MRIKRSYLFAGGIFGAVAAFFILSTLLGGQDRSASATTPSRAAAEAPSVRVTRIGQTLHPYAVTIRGRTEAPRSVQVRAETAGQVAATPTPEGAFVRKGQVLCRLAVDARQASLDQAQAKQRSLELQFQAARGLQEKGFRSETQVLAAKASLDEAAATVRQAQVVLEQIYIRAPFAGVFDNRDVEVGSYLAPGQSCGTVIELDPILVVGHVTETDAARLNVGAGASARLTDGTVLDGKVRFVSRDADAATRTYRVEVMARNAGRAVRSGLSAEIQIRAGEGQAHLVPMSALVLDAAGRQGVRHVVGTRVAFSPVKVVEETRDGVWVTGLTGEVRLITVGQSYVDAGQTVRVTEG